MKENTTKVLRGISKVVLLLVLLLLLGYLGYHTYVGIKSRPYKVRVSNVTDSAFTVSWITDKPMEGVVYYGDNSVFLPGPLSWLGKKVAFDDRDISNAQTECVDRFAKEVSKTKDEDFTVDITDFDCNDVKVKKVGKYYTHHVTVDDLEPNKEYYFRVGTKVVTYAKNKGTYTNNELTGIEKFSTTTRDVFTELGTPRPAFGVTYNLYYDDEKNLVKNISFDSLMFLLAKRDDEVLGYFSGVANNDGGWSIDMGNIRDAKGNVIKETEGIELEFIPQTENFLPANRKKVFLSDVEFPLLMVGNNHDTWENPKEEKQSNISSEKSILGVFQHDASAQSSNCSWLYRSSSGTCECLDSDNGYSTEEACLAKGVDNDKDEMIVGKESRECFDEDGCVCLFDKQGNNYMIRIDVDMGEKCTPKTVCKASDKFPGKLDIQMGEMCIDPSGCECFNGGTYAGVNAECGCECGGECAEDGGDTVTCWNDKCESHTISVTLTGNEVCNNIEYPLKEKPSHCTGGNTPPIMDNKTYKSLVELCGEFHTPALVRYKGYNNAKDNVLVCLANDDYQLLTRRCEDGMGKAVFQSWQLIRITENGDGTYSKGEVVSSKKGDTVLYCPKVALSLAIDVDKGKKIGEQVDEYAQYKCCVTEDKSLGVLGYKYSFQKDCSLVADAKKCTIPLKKTYCIDSKEPNLLFAVLYAQSYDNKHNNDKAVCEEENGEGLSGGIGYANKTAHYGKNCCKSDSYKVAACSGSSQLQWKQCINNGKIGDVFHENPIRYDEFRYGGKAAEASLFKKLTSPVSASDDMLSLEDSDMETVFYFPESGMYEVNTYGGRTAYVLGDKETSYFYFKNRDGVEGYQAPVDPANPKENEDIIMPRVIAEVSISRTTTGKELELKRGVNIISFNFLPTRGGDEMKLTSGDFLKLVNTSGKNVSSISYFSGGQWQGGTSYDFGKQEVKGVSFDLIFGKGYVVIAEEDVTITVPGHNLKSSVPIALSSGWNLVGIHGHKRRYTAKSLINSVNSIEGLKANNVTFWPTNRGMYQGYQQSEGQVYGQDFPISKDLGYFIRINEFNPKQTGCKSILWNPGGQKNGECGTELN